MKDEKNVDGAGLTGQTIPDVEGTEPRLTGMTLHQAAAMLAFLKADCEREHQRAEAAEAVIVAVKELAAKGYRHWDADEDSKAAKVLSALAGVSGCYPALDSLYAQVGGATVTANSGIAGPMSSAQKKNSPSISPSKGKP